MPAENATTRFSDRVADYVRWRPGYPLEVIETLRRHARLQPGQRVADVGSGTGISARMLLDAGAGVWAVEPNADMRAAAEAALGGEPRFRSVSGTAEETSLPDDSMNGYLAAQAFHWFDVPRAAAEARRIVRSDGWAALLWNERRSDTPFLEAYERFVIEHATDYAQVAHQQARQDGRIEAFFSAFRNPVATAALSDRLFTEFVLPNEQVFDFAGLLGRVRSSSYMPGEGHPRFAAMVAALRDLFAAHQSEERVSFAYSTRLYLGKL